MVTVRQAFRRRSDARREAGRARARHGARGRRPAPARRPDRRSTAAKTAATSTSTAMPAASPTVALHSLLGPGAAARSQALPDLSGRAVFVGQSELISHLGDDFATVFSRPDGVDLSGVEIAATAFANLLDGRTLEPAGFGAKLALLGAFGFGVGLIAGLLPGIARGDALPGARRGLLCRRPGRLHACRSVAARGRSAPRSAAARAACRPAGAVSPTRTAPGPA